MPTPTDATQSKPFSMAYGDLELWRLKDGRFLIHVMINKKGPWIELSAEQASWLAGELSK